MIDFLLNSWRFFSWFVGDFIFYVLYQSKTIGLENIPKSEGALIAPNHASGIETVFLPYIILNRFSSRQLWCPAKEELFSFAPLGWLLRSFRSFPVKRMSRDLSSIDTISDLAREHLVLIFPEGTRSKDGKLGKGRSAVGKIIYDSKTTVVPAAVFNTRYFMSKNAWSPNLFLPLTVVFGKPLDMTRFLKMPPEKQTYKKIVEELMNAIASIQKEYAYLDKPPAGLIESSVTDGE